MAKTVIGVIEDPAEAQEVFDELLKSGFDRKDIGIVTPDIISETTAAVTGASKGILFGGLTGMLLGAVAVALGGIGPVLAVGPVLPLLGGTVGAVAGGLIGGLTSKGVPERDARAFADGVRRGGTLIMAVARSDELAARAMEIMKRHGAVDVNESGLADAAAQAVAKQQDVVPQAPTPRGGDVRGDAPGVAATSTTAQPAEAPVVVSAVSVYELEIETPGTATAANQPRYGGPERRVSKSPYAGVERRIAA
jgi:hypothetical protein